jgi:hypothetical protein
LRCWRLSLLCVLAGASNRSLLGHEDLLPSTLWTPDHAVLLRYGGCAWEPLTILAIAARPPTCRRAREWGLLHPVDWAA